jgi:hypothetical protein
MRDIPDRWGVAQPVREAIATLHDAMAGDM